jgi:hypothetical protein
MDRNPIKYFPVFLAGKVDELLFLKVSLRILQAAVAQGCGKSCS